MFFMDRKLKRWEVALLCGVLAALLWSAWAGQEQAELAGQVIRLHVLANSDSQADQELKLAVRDRVLEQAEDLYPEDATLEQAREILEDNLDELAAAGQQVVDEAGKDYLVTAQLEECWFPTKEYENFALPAGEYTALRVVIGEGEGQNWWCVAFPPLCLGVATESVEEATAAGLFTEDQAGLMTRENEGYVLKFKSLELLGELRGLLTGN
ncbi:stage II sporulation protein R [Ruminococcaceae bacterium D16]|nr:stage II sporulation protein R [Ruminococcaceae bacterium D16]